MLPSAKIAFMGFSQGAMLALDSALAMDSPVAGTRVNAPRCASMHLGRATDHEPSAKAPCKSLSI